MQLDPNICYQALLAHDARFDGVFFIAVRSTKIYCRPICRVRVPFQKNCTFYNSAAAAEQAGYRPCLRCRPELAPGSSSFDASARLAGAVARRIEDGALSELSVTELAAELDISERHLRRVVEAEFGVSPLELAQTQRLLLAKQLLTDTDLPITEVAFASGFSSVRRFNALFLERYGLNPTSLRNKKQQRLRPETIVCYAGYRPPYDWDSIYQFLSLRTACGAELCRDGEYLRTAEFGTARGWLAVKPIASKNMLEITVSTTMARSLLPLLNRVRRLFDLNADPGIIAAHLGELADSNPGLRVPGSFFNFETAVRAILGQQVSVKGATTLMKRYVTAYGEPIETPFENLDRLTPTSEKIAAVDAKDLASVVGVPLNRAQTIVGFAKALESRFVNLDVSTNADETIEELKKLPGIGDWTANYIAMRALNWPDAFPAGDLGVKKAMNEVKEKQINDAAERWRPWRSYATMHLWKKLEV